jgi:hypothetical protein
MLALVWQYLREFLPGKSDGKAEVQAEGLANQTFRLKAALRTSF